MQAYERSQIGACCADLPRVFRTFSVVGAGKLLTPVNLCGGARPSLRLGPFRALPDAKLGEGNECYLVAFGYAFDIFGNVNQPVRGAQP